MLFSDRRDRHVNRRPVRRRIRGGVPQELDIRHVDVVGVARLPALSLVGAAGQPALHVHLLTLAQVLVAGLGNATEVISSVYLAKSTKLGKEIRDSLCARPGGKNPLGEHPGRFLKSLRSKSCLFLAEKESWKSH